eukprot:7126522-Pyramimonas_sp.AAC.1
MIDNLITDEERKQMRYRLLFHLFIFVCFSVWYKPRLISVYDPPRTSRVGGSPAPSPTSGRFFQGTLVQFARVPRLLRRLRLGRSQACSFQAWACPGRLSRRDECVTPLPPRVTKLASSDDVLAPSAGAGRPGVPV